MKPPLRALLQSLSPYTPGEQPTIPGVIKLNTNENPYPPSPRVLEALQAITGDQLRRYPDPLMRRFRDAYAERFGLPNTDWVITGNGMDELLSLAVRAFVDPGDAVAAFYPTYTLYEVLSKAHGAAFTYYELDEHFRVTEEFFKTRARLAFFPRPNAPTGIAEPRERVQAFCEQFAGVVVLDEAYVDFAEDSCLDFAQQYENVLVMRSFSKSFSLAGMRIGVAVGNPDLIREMLKIKDSYNMDVVSQAAAVAALEDYDYMQANCRRVQATRARLTDGLQALGFRVLPSEANFVLALWQGTPSAEQLFNALKQQRIYVRYFKAPRLENALRITVGTDEENDTLLAALKALLGRF